MKRLLRKMAAGGEIEAVPGAQFGGDALSKEAEVTDECPLIGGQFKLGYNQADGID